jgi:alkanesulfonate monooxygenase SsuD/methylene tetrahydromethanopterin reductase-like flavin-dependent oxidoreductase (luciferase family)
MKFGVVTSFGTVHDYMAMARDAEAAGWDGVFAWDDISVERGGVFDPWVVSDQSATPSASASASGHPACSP